MRQMKFIKAETPQEFEAIYNETCAELSRFEIIKEEVIGSFERFIYYEESEIKGVESKFICADCLAYKWGQKCLIHGGHRNPTDKACEDVKSPRCLEQSEEDYWRSINDENETIQN